MILILEFSCDPSKGAKINECHVGNGEGRMSEHEFVPS